jgi:hypothetical protein
VKSHNVPPAPLAPAFEISAADQDELNLWLQRSHELYAVASSQGDIKTGLTAIQTAIRALTGLVRQKERAAKKAAAAATITETADSVDDLDTVVRTHLHEQAQAGYCFHCGNKVGSNGFAADPGPGSFPRQLEKVMFND